MRTRRVRLAVAAGYVLSFVLFISGFIVEFNASEAVGWPLLSLAAASMLASRTISRRRQLPAP